MPEESLGPTTTSNPDINVKKDMVDLPDGTGLFDFGHVLVMNSSLPAIFTVDNNGTGDLAIYSLILSSGDTSLSALILFC